MARKIIASGTYIGDGKQEGPSIPMPSNADTVIISEVNVPWRPGGAQGASRDVLSDGDRLLVAEKFKVDTDTGPNEYIIMCDFCCIDVEEIDEQIWKAISWYIPYEDLVRSLPTGEQK